MQARFKREELCRQSTGVFTLHFNMSALSTRVRVVDVVDDDVDVVVVRSFTLMPLVHDSDDKSHSHTNTLTDRHTDRHRQTH